MARNIAVGVGLMEFPFDTTGGFWRWVDLCESGGIDSIWQTDRIVSRQPMLECMTALAAIAGRTKRIKFGVNVVSVAMRDPVLLAKQCATIDVLSEGRLLPGFGIGSPRGPEWTAMHLDPTTRGRRTDEALEIIARLWTGEAVDYAGKHFALTKCSIAPTAGAAGPADVDRRRVGCRGPPDGAAGHRLAGRIGDARDGRAGDRRDQGGGAGGGPFDRRGSLRRRVRLSLRHLGRSAAWRKVAASYQARTGRDAREAFAVGDAATVMARLAEYVEAGASKFILRPAAQGDADMLAQTQRLVEEVLPQVAARWPRVRKAAA